MASIARKARRQKSHSKHQRKNERLQRRRSKKNRRHAQRPAPLPGRIARIVGALFAFFAGAFTRPTWQRFVVLLFAAILTTGSRTISNLLRTVDLLAPGDPSSYHRVMSKRCWSIWRLSRALASFIFARWLPQGTIQLAGDDTVAEHKGKKVFGKGCHRDAVRSTHSFTAFRWGHKWVVLAVLVKFPFATRPWALPILCALYRTEKDNEACGRRHKTPAELMRQMLVVLLRWFPERRFVFIGDGGYGTHPLAWFAHRHRQRLALVSRFYPDANLYALPAQPKSKKGAGRPRKKGRKLPKPEAVVKRAKRKRLHVTWYGGGERNIEIVTRDSHHAGQSLVQGLRRLGSGSLGVCSRPHRHSPRRVLLQHGCRTQRQGDRRGIHAPLEHRDDVPRNAHVAEGREDARLDGEDGAANSALLVWAVRLDRGDLRGVAGEMAS